MNGLVKILKDEIVLVIAVILAVISSFFVKPNIGYLNYIDFKVLAILFCLMIVVAGLKQISVFDIVSKWLLDKTDNITSISFILIALCFISSMFITNDVALITFVPLSIILLTDCDEKVLILAIVLQTIAANIGSMFTPIGNPQNLYLYSNYNLNAVEFFKSVLPVGFIGLLLLLLSASKIKGGKIELKIEKSITKFNKNDFIIYMILFGICFLTVFNKISYVLSFFLVLSYAVIKNKNLIKEVDYSLLLTFIAFFIFVGNLENINLIRESLTYFIEGNEFLSSIVLSQFISNLPAALMISGFTDNYNSILRGVNIGGLGTLIASMASLISYRLYLRSKNNKVEYIKVFTVYNFGFLLVIVSICLFIGLA